MIAPLRLGLAATLCLAAGAARPATADISKEACIDAHSRGQDARDAGKISMARKLFLTCAQSACPAVVQNDCARFADELSRQQPTISFVARDEDGNDLPDTAVYVDDALVVTQLDDGLPHDVDPGKHVVRFENAGREKSVTVILANGEQGRTVVATFPGRARPSGGNAAPGGTSLAQTGPPKIRTVTRHPSGAKWLMLTGGVLAAAGLGFGAYEITKFPSNCSLSSHECVAPPGDPSLGKASDAVKWGQIGFAVGAVGAACVIGGLVWYIQGAHTEHPDFQLSVEPMLVPDGGGIAFGGAL